MTQPPSLSSLTQPEQRLIKMCQELAFGRIEGVRVTGGAPVFQPGPRVVRTLKMGTQNGPREEVSHTDFLLKRAVVELVEVIRTLRDDEVVTITVLHGLPHLVEIQRDGAL